MSFITEMRRENWLFGKSKIVSLEMILPVLKEQMQKLDRENSADSAFSTLKLVTFCICVSVHQTPRNMDFETLVPVPFHKYSTCHVYLQLCPKLYLCICVFVFVYLHVMHSRTLILRSWHHCIFIIIAHAMSICIMPWNKSKVRK